MGGRRLTRVRVRVGVRFRVRIRIRVRVRVRGGRQAPDSVDPHSLDQRPWQGSCSVAI